MDDETTGRQHDETSAPQPGAGRGLAASRLRCGSLVVLPARGLVVHARPLGWVTRVWSLWLVPLFAPFRLFPVPAPTKARRTRGRSCSRSRGPRRPRRGPAARARRTTSRCGGRRARAAGPRRGRRGPRLREQDLPRVLRALVGAGTGNSLNGANRGTSHSDHTRVTQPRGRAWTTRPRAGSPTRLPQSRLEAARPRPAPPTRRRRPSPRPTPALPAS